MDYLEGPDVAQMELIKGDLGEDLDRHQNNVQLLQKWISCQTHLPQDYENSMLSIFLRGCKHNLEKAKEKVELYFIARTKIPELFGNRSPTRDLMEKYTKMIKIAPLQKLTPNGERVTIFKIEKGDGEEWELKDVLRYVFITADIRVSEEQPISGDVFLYDLKNIQAYHILKYISPLLKKALLAANEAYPQRLKQLHLINTPIVAEKGLNATKAFLKEKIRKRFVIHETVEGVTKFIPSNILPEEYGGSCGNFEDLVNEWTECIIKRNKWFEQQDNVKATGIPANVQNIKFNDINGIQGSFRKLEID